MRADLRGEMRSGVLRIESKAQRANSDAENQTTARAKVVLGQMVRNVITRGTSACRIEILDGVCIF